MRRPGVMKGLPERVDLHDGLHLRWFTEADADAIARSVGESLEHLRPWMPWANAESADVEFQRRRLRTLPALRDRGEEWQYGLFRTGSDAVLGSFGLMTRRGPGTLEIGYWLHVDQGGQGFATAAASALTSIARAIPRVDLVIIWCDEANVRSAAIPQRLGYALKRTETRPPEAPGESGRMQIWTIAGEGSAAERRA
jgi:RimJ/RimL family protein N-acetyltransferase